MVKKPAAVLLGAALLCFAAAQLCPPVADAKGMIGKLERCRNKMKSNTHAALDCFSEVMVEGNDDERRAATYYLGMLVEYIPENIPTVSEVMKSTKEKAAAAAGGEFQADAILPDRASARKEALRAERPPGETTGADAGTTRVKTPGGGRQSAAPAPKNGKGRLSSGPAAGKSNSRNNTARAAARPLARAPGGASPEKWSNTAAPKKTASARPGAAAVPYTGAGRPNRGRTAALPAGTGRSRGFQVEEVLRNISVRVSPAGTPRKGGARVSQVGGGYDVKEILGSHKKAAVARPVGTTNSKGVVLQEMEGGQNVAVAQSALNQTSESWPPVATDAVGQVENAGVELSSLDRNTMGFTIDEDLAQEPARVTSEGASRSAEAGDGPKPVAIEIRLAESIVNENTEVLSPSAVASAAAQAEDPKKTLARLNTNTAAFTIEDDVAPGIESANEQVGEVRFETDAVEIGDAQLSAMGQAAKFLVKESDKMTVRGLASPDEKNPENLAKVRAKIVAHLLKKKFRVTAARIQLEWGVGASKDDQCVLIIVTAQ